MLSVVNGELYSSEEPELSPKRGREARTEKVLLPTGCSLKPANQ